MLLLLSFAAALGFVLYSSQTTYKGEFVSLLCGLFLVDVPILSLWIKPEYIRPVHSDSIADIDCK